MVVYGDIETYNPVDDLVVCGAYRYSENVEILLFSYAVGDTPVKVVDLTAGEKIPVFPVGTVFCFHNSNFDRIQLQACGYDTERYRWVDTSVQALALSLPGSLGKLGTELGLQEDQRKLKEGKRLINRFCKPAPKTHKVGRYTRLNDPEGWARFTEYARMDIVAMREVARRLPKWNDTKDMYEEWLTDQRINDRGTLVDQELVRSAITSLSIVDGDLQKRFKEATGLASTSQNKAILERIQSLGANMPNLQKGTVDEWLLGDIPEKVREILQFRKEAAGAASKKYKKILKCVCKDGRLRGMTKFCGAPATGRWSSQLVQLQNLATPKKGLDVDAGIVSLKNGSADLLYDVNELCKSAVRGCFIAPIRKKLVVADLSAIEGRVLAWLAQEGWKLKAYCDYDEGIGYDAYVNTYATTFGIDPSEVQKWQRQHGKVIELFGGYEGGVGAFVTFGNNMGVNLDELAKSAQDSLSPYHKRKAESWYAVAKEQGRDQGLSEKTFVALDTIKRMWREKNPATVRFWSDLKTSYRAAVSGQPTRIGFIEVDGVDGWVRFRLPSGRYLCYRKAALVENKCSYMGMDSVKKQWRRQYTYGGKLAENITQAVARDFLVHGMLEAEKQGYEVVFHVHDELIAEVPDTDEYSAETLSSIMADVPSWAPGIPLAAEGFETYRYRKE